MARYEIWLTTDTGRRLTLLDQMFWLSYTRTVNGVGTFVVGLPPSINTSWIRKDRMMQIWRAPIGGRLTLFRAYFLTAWRYFTQGSVDLLTIRGVGMNHLLWRRHVAFAAGSSQATKTAKEADDLLKDVVSDNLISAGSPDYGSRGWNDLSTGADISQGPTLTNSFPWRRVIRVCRDISEASAVAGSRLYFDIAQRRIEEDSFRLEFRTYIGQPGRDLTSIGVVFDQERGNLESPFLDYDYTDEENYIYALGQGEGADREVQQVYDTARHDASRWGRCEGVVNANSQGLANGVREAGRARLKEKEPVRKMGGRIVDTAAFAFMKHWNWGDKVRARYRGIEFDAIIGSLQVYVNGDGEETIKGRLEYVS